MKAYIATGFKQRDLYAQLAKVCNDIGVEVTYDWTLFGPPDDPEERADYRAHNATKEIEGVQAADLLIVGLPGGFGTASELGAALACDIPVLTVGEVPMLADGLDPINIFLEHPLVTQLASVEQLRAQLGWLLKDRIAEEMFEHLRILDLECNEKLSPPAFSADRKRLVAAWDKVGGL
jgi:hypothetical protein